MIAKGGKMPSSALRRVLVGLALLLSWTAGAAPEIDRSADRVKTDLNPGLERIGTIRPRGVTEVGESNWTIGCECLDRDMADYWAYNRYLAPLGIKTIRLQAGWNKTEREKGRYDFTWLDRIIDDALGQGLNIWLETDYGNTNYAGGGGVNLGAGFPVSEEALRGWDSWVGAMARRYKGKVRDWAMWNEPDGNKKLTPEKVAAFNIRTAETIKREIPDARIGALSVSWFIADKYMPYFEEQGKTGLFDWIVYHGYCKNPDDHTGKALAMRKKLLARWPNTPPLRQGEQGCPSERITKFALSNLPWTEFSQSKWILRRMMGDLGIGSESSIFTIADIDYGLGSIINRKGLLHTAPDKQVDRIKMSYYAVQNAVSVFDRTLERVAGDVISVKFSTNTVSYVYQNKATGQQLLVLWDRSNVPSDSAVTSPALVTLAGCTIKEPVWVDLVSGRIYAFPAERVAREGAAVVFKDVPVYDAPALLAEKALVVK